MNEEIIDNESDTMKLSCKEDCDELCKKHNTDRLRLLSVIQQKLNGDMIVRLNESPVFRDKVKGALNEWNEEIDPILVVDSSSSSPSPRISLAINEAPVPLAVLIVINGKCAAS